MAVLYIFRGYGKRANLSLTVHPGCVPWCQITGCDVPANALGLQMQDTCN